MTPQEELALLEAEHELAQLEKEQSIQTAPPGTQTPMRAVARPEQPPPDMVNVVRNASYKAIAGIPDAVLNTPNRLINMAKGAYMTPLYAATGKEMFRPEFAEDPDYVRKVAESAGLIRPEYAPKGGLQQAVDVLTQGAMGGALTGGASLPRVAIGAGLGSLSSGAGAATESATGSQTAGIAASLLAPSAVGRLSRPSPRPQMNDEQLKTLKDASALGYKFTPSSVDPTFMNRMLESESGKIATAQEGSMRNAAVTDRIAREATGLAPFAPITRDAMAAGRGDDYAAGYAPVAGLGPMRLDRTFDNVLNSVEQKYTGTSRSFPGSVPAKVSDLVDRWRNYRVFDAGDAIQQTQVLRDAASEAYKLGDTGYAKALKTISKGLEDNIERQIAASGRPGATDMLDAFRDARKRMAIKHTVEDAVRVGGGTTDPKVFAREAQKGTPLSDDLRTAGRYANIYEKVNARPGHVGGAGVHNLKAMFSGLGALAGGAAGHQSGLGPVVGGALGAVAPFVIPDIARNISLSNWNQQRILNRLEPLGTPHRVSPIEQAARERRYVIQAADRND